MATASLNTPVRAGRTSSQISIFDYPEHLNPFYEEEQHKRLRFWNIGSFGKGPKRRERSNSFSLDGLKDFWTLKSFRSKKRSSTLGINKTSESPPPLRKEDLLTVSSPNKYDTYNPNYRNTFTLAPAKKFERNVGERASLQDISSYRNNEMYFNPSNHLKRANESDNMNSNTSTPVLKHRNGIVLGSSQTSLNSTNPFEDDNDEENESKCSTKISKPRRKKRRAPPPPTTPKVPLAITVAEENEEEHSKIIHDLTMEIESFVKNSSEISDEINSSKTTTSIENKNKIDEKPITECNHSDKNNNICGDNDVICHKVEKVKESTNFDNVNCDVKTTIKTEEENKKILVRETNIYQNEPTTIVKSEINTTSDIPNKNSQEAKINSLEVIETQEKEVQEIIKKEDDTKALLIETKVVADDPMTIVKSETTTILEASNNDPPGPETNRIEKIEQEEVHKVIKIENEVITIKLDNSDAKPEIINDTEPEKIVIVEENILVQEKKIQSEHDVTNETIVIEKYENESHKKPVPVKEEISQNLESFQNLNLNEISELEKKDQQTTDRLDHNDDLDENKNKSTKPNEINDVDLEKIELPKVPPIPPARYVYTHSSRPTTLDQRVKTKYKSEIETNNNILRIVEPNEDLNKMPGPHTVKTENYEFQVRYVPLRNDPDMKESRHDRWANEYSKYNLRRCSNEDLYENGNINKRRKSVKEIIDSINKSQSLLKINQDSGSRKQSPEKSFNDNLLTNKNDSTDSITRNLNILTNDEKKINEFLIERSRSCDTMNSKSNKSDFLPTVVEKINEKIEKGNKYAFEKCKKTRDQENNNIEWNPVPKPRRTKNLSPSSSP